MKGKRDIVLIVLLVVIAIGIAAYPILGDIQHSILQKKMIKEYDTALQNLQQDDIREEWKQARAYNRSLAPRDMVISDPFNASSKPRKTKGYDYLLDIDGDGMMGSVEIPKINLKLPIMHGTDEETLQNAVGHLPGTSLPVGGKSTHAVLSAHRGLPSAELFTNLDQLVEGDYIILHILDKTLYYKIDRIKVVKPEETDDLMICEGKDYLTLVTCTPYSINSHRLLVRGERTKIPPGENASQNHLWTFLRLHAYECAFTVILCMACIAMILILKKTSQNKRG